MSAAKRILFISYDGMTDPLGQSQVIPYLKGLTGLGYTFTLLSCDKPEKYAAHKEYVQQLLATYPIEWVSIPYHKNPPVLSSWYDYRMLRRTAAALHLRTPFSMVHTRVGVPALVGYWLKRKLGIPFLNDIRGFWADERVDGGMWDIKNPVYKAVYNFFKKKEDQFIIAADFNTCLTFAARTEIHKWKRIPDQPIPLEVIPCSADMDLFDPATISAETKQRFSNELGIHPGEIIITYLGSIGGWYLTDEMMRFCRLVSDRMPSAKFLFLSPHKHEVIRSAALKFGLPLDKLIIRHSKRHEVPALLSLSTYAVFFIKPCYSKVSSSPTKHGEIMAMGIPVITNSGVGDVKEIVAQYNAGYVVDDFSDAAFNNVIDQLMMGDFFNRAAIREGAIEFYSLTHAVEKYNSVYQTVFDQANIQ